MDVKNMNKIKIMLSSPMKGKTKQEIDIERDEMANMLFDYYGDDNCEITSSVAMGYGWKNARGCRLEHEIAKAYHKEVVYLDELKKGLLE